MLRVIKKYKKRLLGKFLINKIYEQIMKVILHGPNSNELPFNSIKLKM